MVIVFVVVSMIIGVLIRSKCNPPDSYFGEIATGIFLGAFSGAIVFLISLFLTAVGTISWATAQTVSWIAFGIGFLSFLIGPLMEKKLVAVVTMRLIGTIYTEMMTNGLKMKCYSKLQARLCKNG